MTTDLSLPCLRFAEPAPYLIRGTGITNEKGQRLKDRFEVLIKDTSFFDCLVGYFAAEGIIRGKRNSK